MSVVNSIRSIAYSEASTLGEAVALVAKHRNELEATLRAKADQTMPLANEGAATERALREIESASLLHKVDKRA
jgi:hypothetical protein